MSTLRKLVAGILVLFAGTGATLSFWALVDPVGAKVSDDNDPFGQPNTTEPAAKAKKTIAWVHEILAKERSLVFASKPLEATMLQVENIKWAYVFYESGLSINVLYTLDDPKKRAVGFKLSDGMEVPDELATKFKFARQKSKLAGTIRGSYFVVKGEY